MEEERKAFITATAFKGTRIMTDNFNNEISICVTTSTDIPADAIGEVVTEVLRRAWMTGINPAQEAGFHIKVNFA
jgi:hypothetical protein